MKTIKASRYLLTGLFIAGAFLTAGAQKTGTKTNAVFAAVDAKRFVFVAQNMTPMRGGLRQLNSYYDLRVSKDTVISNLPYFGRAYVAPIDPQQGGLNFTSTAFDYAVKTGKKGRRDVTINTRSNGDTQGMTLNVYDNGSANLQVTSNNRDPVSFSGYVKAPDNK